MKKQCGRPVPAQQPRGECGWWGGGTGDEFVKRRGSQLDLHVPSKLPRTVEQGHRDSLCTPPDHDGTNHDGSSAWTSPQGKGGNDPDGIRNMDEPETTSSSITCNSNGLLPDVTRCDNAAEQGIGEMVFPSCILREVSMQTGTNLSPCEVNCSGSSTISSLIPEMIGSLGEGILGVETVFHNETAAITSTDVDQLCCDLDNKVPKSITSLGDCALNEKCGKVLCCNKTLEAADGRTVRFGAEHNDGAWCAWQSAFVNLEAQTRYNGASESRCKARSKASGEKVEDATFGNESLWSDDGEVPKKNAVPDSSGDGLFSTEVATDEHRLRGVKFCLESGDVESLDEESSVRNESAAEAMKPVEEQNGLVQDVGVPGTSQEREVASDDEDNRSVDSYNSDIPDEEIEAMLEEGLLRKPENQLEQMVPSNQREKVVLEELGHDHFDVLPEGWVKVTHYSGMPVYLHKASRVCNITKPYFLGQGSGTKHEIPLSAILCLQYRRALEEELANSENAAVTVGPGGIQLPNACIETAEENKARHSVSAEQIREYCKKAFATKRITITQAKKSSGKKKPRDQKQISRPTLPEGTKLIKFPVENKRPVLNNTRKKKEWILNPNGKSYVCILHEYVQHALKKQPSYIFKETEQPGQPYSASVMIDQVQYGVGCGSSKKHAKSEAAKQTLEILIPEMREKIEEDRRAGHCKASASCNTDLSIFDEIRIEDPRVAELCAKTTEPSPYAILLTCLQRNFGLGELDVKCKARVVRHLNIEYVMTVGKHTAVVMCKNKRDGKQRTSQAVLQKLHPHIKSWGSILRMYGSSSIKSMKDKKQEEQEITFLQSKAEENEPNYAILRKLEETMFKLATEYKSIGKFIPPSDEKLPSCSGADLNTVNM